MILYDMTRCVGIFGIGIGIGISIGWGELMVMDGIGMCVHMYRIGGSWEYIHIICLPIYLIFQSTNKSTNEPINQIPHHSIIPHTQ